MEGGNCMVTCPVAPPVPRIDAQKLGSDFALHPETKDLYVENGSIARVSGVDYLPAKNTGAAIDAARGKHLCRDGGRALL